MFLQDLKPEKKYKVKGKPLIRVIDRTPGVGEFGETIQIPSGTTLTVIRQNGASVRVHLKFRDKDSEDKTVRIPFVWVEYEFEEVGQVKVKK